MKITRRKFQQFSFGAYDSETGIYWEVFESKMMTPRAAEAMLLSWLDDFPNDILMLTEGDL